LPFFLSHVALNCLTGSISSKRLMSCYDADAEIVIGAGF
jgi:hypothetical protein